jgi:hypothetical protein
MRWAGAYLLACGLAAGVGAAPTGGDAESTCVSCHEQEEAGQPAARTVELGEALRFEVVFATPVREWRESVHAVHEVSCDACHGGDPHEPDEELSMSEEAGFLENPAWTEMAGFCGVCHEGVAESFTAGRFGRLQDEGVRVATCDTCHMAEGHRIRAARPEELRLAAQRCASCPPVEEADALVAELHELRELDTRLRARAAAVEARGIELADVRAALSALRDEVSWSVHAFEPADLRAARADALERYDTLGEVTERYAREAEVRRAHGLVLLAALSLLFLALWAAERTRRRGG